MALTRVKVKDIVDSHWKAYLQMSFPRSLIGLVVDGYDYEALARQAISYLHEVFEEGKDPRDYISEFRAIQSQLAQAAVPSPQRRGRTWQYFYHLSEMTRLLQIDQNETLPSWN